MNTKQIEAGSIGDDKRFWELASEYGRAVCTNRRDEVARMFAEYIDRWAAARIAPAPIEPDDADAYVIDCMGKMLARIAIAVIGKELPLQRHGYQDVPELVELAMLELAIFRATESSTPDAPVLSAAQHAIHNLKEYRAGVDMCFPSSALDILGRFVAAAPAPSMQGESSAESPASVTASQPVAWLPMGVAPKDGTLLRLLVQFDDNATEDSAEPCPTIGANNFDNDQQDEWKFAGWDWQQDCFAEGFGKPVGWLPMIDIYPTKAEAPASGQDDPAVPYTYASTQATKCADCGEYKHTPLRIDAMGGYVCLTCIDKKLGSLLGEFGYAIADAPFGRPNKWTVLLTSDNHGLVAEFGETFDRHPAHYERINVYAGAAPTSVTGEALSDEQCSEIRERAALTADLWAESLDTEPTQAEVDVVFIRAILAATKSGGVSVPAAQAGSELDIQKGQKGWRPACCDRGADISVCCDDGCAADKERASLAKTGGTA
jgi:hypothetical protein